MSLADLAAAEDLNRRGDPRATFENNGRVVA